MEVKTDSLVLNRGAKPEEIQLAKQKFIGTPVWFTDVYANNQRLILCTSRTLYYIRFSVRQ